MMTMQTKKDAFTHMMANVLDFQSGYTMNMERTDCGYDKIDNIATMDKDNAMVLKYSKSITDTPNPMKTKNKLLYLLWWIYYTVSLKSDKVMSTDEWMKIMQDDYEAFQSKWADTIDRSGEGQSRAVNKTTEVPSTSYF